MDTLVITHQKGGVGKTTIAALLAWWFAQKDQARVALLDLDSQKNLTRTFARHRYLRAAPLFAAAGLRLADRPPGAPCLFAGATELSDLERASPEVIRHLRNHVVQLRPHFDYCLIDTPHRPWSFACAQP